jgi:hypothetical protein
MQGNLSCDVNVGNSIAHAIKWTLISFFTLGIGAMFFPYAFAGHVMNHTFIEQNGTRVAKLEADVSLTGMAGHIALWFLICAVTCGLGYIVYLYKVVDFVQDRTKIVPI